MNTSFVKLSILISFNLLISQTTNAQGSQVNIKQNQSYVFVSNDADILSSSNDSTRASIKMNYTPVVVLGIFGLLSGTLIGGKINPSKGDGSEFEAFSKVQKRTMLIGTATGVIAGYFAARKDMKHKQKKANAVGER